MGTVITSKINRLMQSQPYGVVFLSSWLREQGYSFELQKRYKNSRWLEAIGTGAMKRAAEEIQIEETILALQKKLNKSVHIGGRSAMEMLGKSHYLEDYQKEVTLFGQAGEKIPKWFTDYPWEQK